MGDPVGNEQEEHAPPGRRVTANMLVGYNIAFFRQAAGLTQEQLGERLGWTNVAVSAAERSWDGKRVRKFDADEIIAIAQALGVPSTALLLPPLDDTEQPHVLRQPGAAGAMTMARYFRHVVPIGHPGGLETTDVMTAYQTRFVGAADAYLGKAAAGEINMRFIGASNEGIIAGFLRHAQETRVKLAGFADVLPDVIQDNDVMQDILEAALGVAHREQFGRHQEEASGDAAGSVKDNADGGEALPAVLLS